MGRTERAARKASRNAHLARRRFRGPESLRARAAFAAALALAASICLSSCQPRRRRLAPGETPVLGFSLDSLVVERWRRDVEVFTRSARELGAEVELRVADQDWKVQEVQVRELLEKGIDVLVIVPNDADLLSEAVIEARSRGVPVLSYDRLVRGAGVDLYVSFDNEKVGSLMAEAVARSSPGGSLVLINGAKSDNNAVMLNAGMHRILDPLVASGAIRIGAEIWPESWDSEEARLALEAVIAGGWRVDGVIAGNDMLAEAAIKVLSENRLMDGVEVSGQDAELAACQRIAEGTQLATVYKPIERLALKAAGFAVMLARGERIETDSFIDDGKGRVPYVRLEPILVTKELLESTVIEDGFHSREEVYRNIRRR